MNILRHPSSSLLPRGMPTFSNVFSRSIHCSIHRQSTSILRQIPRLPARKPHPHLQHRHFLEFRRRIEYEKNMGTWNSLRYHIIAAFLTGGLGLLLVIYGVTAYQTWVQKTLHNYPPSVAKELRKALYYARDSSAYSPRDALKHFFAALENAREERMHPLSREVTGIKIEIARVCEQYGRKDKAVEVLQDLWGSLRAGVELWDAKVKSGSGVQSIKPPMVTAPEGAEGKTPVQPISALEREIELERERTGLVRRAVEIGVKLGSLLLEDWADEALAGDLTPKQRRQSGERILELTAESIIAQERRIHERGNDSDVQRAIVDHEGSKPVKVGEDSRTTAERDPDTWLTPLEIASTFEILATHYLSTSRPNLAAPLLIHAVQYLYPTSPNRPSTNTIAVETLCHAATIMTTISAALSELPSVAPSASTATTSHPPPNTHQPTPTEASEYWSNLASAITSQEPTASSPRGLAGVLKSDECRQARITALVNLAELMLQRGEKGSAKAGFEEAEKLAKKMGWGEGAQRARAGLGMV